MRSIKNHFSFIVPLFILLFSVQFSLMLNRAARAYENNLTHQYALVIVAKKPLKTEEMTKEVPYIASIEEIKKRRYLESFKDKISRADLVYLKATLPHFYSLKLTKLPNDQEIKLIAQKLQTLPNVQKVETFTRTFNRFQQYLKFSKSASNIFTIFILFIALMLIVKQMEIWTLEHQNRMYVMGLFGAPYWMKSASLYKSVVIDAMISAILAGLIFYFLPHFVDFGKIEADLGLDLNNFQPLSDTFRLILFSLLISIISVTITILRQKDS